MTNTAQAMAPAAFAYQLCGLRLASCLALPAGGAWGGDEREPDVWIARGAVPENLAGAEFRGPTWEYSGAEILLRVPTLGRLLMRGGREIVYDVAAGAEANLPVFLLGSALGALLHQRGEYVLHASAIAVDGEAVVFCGPSGAGKSSLVAALCAAGYPLLADDVCRIQFGRRGPSVVPDGRRLKLWEDTIAHLGLGARRGEAVRNGIAKFWVEPPARAAEEALPVRALYILHSGEELVLERATLVSAMEHLRALAYRPRLVKILGQEAMWLNRSAVLYGKARVMHLRRPWGLGGMGACLDLLRDAWSRG